MSWQPFLSFPRRRASGIGGNDANTILLLHCDGTNGSTSFTDSSSNGATVTANGNAAVSTAQSQFGGASLGLDGTGDYLSVPDANNFDFGSGDFTIDMWVRLAGTSSFQTIYGKRANSSAVDGLILVVQSGSILFYASSGGAWNIWSGAVCGSISANTWTHIGVSRSSNNWYGFVGGTVTSLGSSASSIAANSAAVTIGGDTNGLHVNGHIDEVRVSNIARWTATFTPPTAPYD